MACEQSLDGTVHFRQVVIVHVVRSLSPPMCGLRRIWRLAWKSRLTSDGIRPRGGRSCALGNLRHIRSVPCVSRGVSRSPPFVTTSSRIEATSFDSGLALFSPSARRVTTARSRGSKRAARRRSGSDPTVGPRNENASHLEATKLRDDAFFENDLKVPGDATLLRNNLTPGGA
jgi:hypothetical protein